MCQSMILNYILKAVLGTAIEKMPSFACLSIFAQSFQWSVIPQSFADFFIGKYTADLATKLLFESLLSNQIWNPERFYQCLSSSAADHNHAALFESAIEFTRKGVYATSVHEHNPCKLEDRAARN